MCVRAQAFNLRENTRERTMEKELDVIVMGIVDHMAAGQLQSLVERLSGVYGCLISTMTQRMTLKYDANQEATVLQTVQDAILATCPNAQIKW